MSFEAQNAANSFVCSSSACFGSINLHRNASACWWLQNRSDPQSLQKQPIALQRKARPIESRFDGAEVDHRQAGGRNLSNPRITHVSESSWSRNYRQWAQSDGKQTADRITCRANLCHPQDPQKRSHSAERTRLCCLVCMYIQ